MAPRTSPVEPGDKRPARTRHARSTISLSLWLSTVVVGLAGCLLIGIAATRQEIREIDVNSGRVRERHIVFGIQLAESRVETHFTHHFATALHHQPQPKWRTVSIKHGSDWFRENVLDRKEHFVFGDVYGDLETFALMCDAGVVDESRCQEHADHLLDLLHDQNARAISEKVRALQTETDEADAT